MASYKEAKKESIINRFHTHSILNKEENSYRGWLHFPMYSPTKISPFTVNLELQLLGFILGILFFTFLDAITLSIHGNINTSIGFSALMVVSYNIFSLFNRTSQSSLIDDNSISLEFLWGKAATRLSLSLSLDNDGEDHINFNLSIPKVFCLYLGFNLGYSYLIKLTNLKKSTKHQRNNGKGYLFEPYHGHTTGFSIDKEYCHFDFLYCDSDSSFNRFFSFHKGIDTETLLYGELSIETQEEFIPNGLTKPEYKVTINVPAMGEYSASVLVVKVSFKRIVHNRKRWKDSMSWVSTNISGLTATGPVERNGKGENGWDCDPVDMSLPELSAGKFIHPDNVEEYYINHIKEQREKYG